MNNPNPISSLITHRVKVKSPRFHPSFSRHSRQKLGRKARGISLIEALVSMAVMLGGMAAILGFHATVAGNSAQNRLSNAALSAAQAKLEEFRNRPFQILQSEPTSDTVEITSPMIGSESNLELTRCWAFEEVPEVGSNLLNASVAVVRSGETCNPAGASLAKLTTFIAQTDPRTAANNVEINRIADGEGSLLPAFDPPSGDHPTLPGGFELIKGEDGTLEAIYNPLTGEAIVPKNEQGALKYAQINGNIIFKGERNASAIDNLRISAEGVGTCRLFYPGSEGDSPNAPPKVSAGTATVTYVQYSCVVTNGWRRSIILLPASDESVCVGYPELQPEKEGEDILSFNGRQYYGYGWEVDAEGGKRRIAVGMRGTTDGSSTIGSMCTIGQPCWQDPEVRGWIPGGHHFFVKEKEESCATAMTVLEEIDNTITDPHSMYAMILFRNPHKVYCTNDKDYTNDLSPITVGDEPVTATDCRSYTKLSGFLVNEDQANMDGWSIILGSSSRFYTGCRPIGRFGAHGGGYVCGYGEDVADIQFTPYASGKTFNPAKFTGLSPLQYPHDITAKNFAFTTAGSTETTPSDPSTEEPVQTPDLTSCDPFIVTGARVRNATVTLNESECTYPDNNKKDYMCAAENVSNGTIFTLTHIAVDNTDVVSSSSEEITVSSSMCNLTMNFGQK